MSDWDQSGRLSQCVGEAFLNPEFAFLFWTDFPTLLFLNSQQHRRNTAALKMPSLADFCQRSLVQTGSELGRQASAGMNILCYYKPISGREPISTAAAKAGEANSKS